MGWESDEVPGMTDNDNLGVCGLCGRDPQALEAELEGHRQAVEEFNAGWECCQEGGTLADEPSYCPQDNWRNGFLARESQAEIERLQTEIELLRASCDEWKQELGEAREAARFCYENAGDVAAGRVFGLLQGWPWLEDSQ